MFSYISMNFIFSQYWEKKEEKNRKGKRKAFYKIYSKTTSYERLWTSIRNIHCNKSARIRSYSGPYLIQMRENTDQNNSKYEHFLRKYF